MHVRFPSRPSGPGSGGLVLAAKEKTSAAVTVAEVIIPKAVWGFCPTENLIPRGTW
ncbi:hypothetical protein HF885_07675 [Olsenella umbonata]|uniref:Uncharacterized protein n=1 Tax=Parafannyhessea umbonata TaxID=604330 RepID=A0A7X9Y0S9_9ACTN|nr:hypothetical protein [Parafannyhessea umbonata]